jgi:hypothetical protein
MNKMPDGLSKYHLRRIHFILVNYCENHHRSEGSGYICTDTNKQFLTHLLDMKAGGSRFPYEIHHKMVQF